MLDALPTVILYELTLYLKPTEVFQALASLNQSFSNLFKPEEFKTFYLKSYLGINMPIKFYHLTQAFLDFHQNDILQYQGIRTTGGVSQRELKNSYQNMWTYSPETYSTEYSEDSDLPLVKNICCSASFLGVRQKKKFRKYFYSDICQLIYDRDSLPAKYNDLSAYNLNKLFVPDPLDWPFELTEESMEDLPFYNNLNYYDKKLQAPDATICQNIPIIKKISVARPFFFTGCVKSMILILSRDGSTEDFTAFDKFNDIENYESTIGVGKEVNHICNDEFEFVEFEEKKEEFYPAAWILFKTIEVNHLLIELKKCHFAKFACVKMISIEDRREEFSLESMQPNYDIMYFLLIGSILEHSDNDVNDDLS